MNRSNLLSTFTTLQDAINGLFLSSFSPTISLEVCRSGAKPQPNYRAARWPSRSPTTVARLAHSSLLSPLSLHLSLVLSRSPSLTGSAPLLSTSLYPSCYLLHHPFMFFFLIHRWIRVSPTSLVVVPLT